MKMNEIIRNGGVTVLLLAVAASVAGAQTRLDGPIEIPLHVRDGLLLVPVEAADGTVFEFILSMGNSTALSASTAARLGDDPALTIGGVPLSMQGRFTVPDDSLAADGMVGPTTLNQFDVLIDVPGERLVLKPVGRSVAWDGMSLSNPVTVQVFHDVMMSLSIELNGEIYRSLLDLGWSTLVVNDAVRTQLRFEPEDVATLGIGYASLVDLPIRVLDLPIFSGWDPNNGGFVILGAPIAYDCAISLSWAHKEIRTCVR